MVFSSLVFIYFFLPIVMVLYFFGGIRYKNIILFISGLVFYAWGEPFYICIMLISTAIDYTAGRFMDKFDNDDKKRRICLLVSVIMNISLLALFKYSDFFTNNINSIFHTSVTNPVILANKRVNHIFP
ncbi:MAG: MBOAT family protein, partial [Oscillospiraceae bacterium]|nr:MBOAT family protein [Oscillospiraceae bacterium]